MIATLSKNTHSLSVAVKELTPNEFDMHLDPIVRHIETEAGQPGRYNPKHFYPVWQNLMKLGSARTWEAPGCVLGAIFFADVFSGDLYAAVHFWWSLPEVRGSGLPIRLFKRFELEARAAACKRISVASYEALHPDNLNAVYPRLGYRLHETVFSKEL